MSDGSDRDRGQAVLISESAIEADALWLRLAAEEKRFDKSSGALTLHGDHGGELVHVTLELLSPTRALLTWVDGIAGPTRLLLGRTRPPLRATWREPSGRALVVSGRCALASNLQRSSA